MNRFQNKILTWYKQNKRDLPWRETTNPYYILVSEIMLQQTQVDRVIPYYIRFLKKFPTLERLARAQKPTLLKYWSGLGYNNRILRLQKLAQVVIKEKEGKIPKTVEELIELPGIGPYTADAVMAFAFNKDVPVMDTNIRRVLIHELKLKEDLSLEEMKEIALKNVPKGKSCIWHNALMDYGATKATARATGIESLSKQGTFEGSDRQIRGAIIKLLLKEKSISVSKLKDFDQKQLIRVIEKMKQEEIITQKAKILKFH